MHFQESLLPVFLGIIWQASCWILAVFCVGERKSTSEFTGFGGRWIGICTTRSTKWTHKGFWMLYQSASPSPTSKDMSTGTREKETTSSANQRETSWPMTKKNPENLNGKRCRHPSSEIRWRPCLLWAEKQSLGKESLSTCRYLMRLNSQSKRVHGHGGDTDLKPGNSHVCKKVAVTFQCRPHLKKTQLKRTLGESPFAKQVL